MSIATEKGFEIGKCYRVKKIMFSRLITKKG